MVYLLVAGLFALYTPPWQAPDEPAHYNYARQLAEGHWPVMATGDYNQAYLNQIISDQFPPQEDISVLTYEDWQPPLYYLLLTPIFELSGGSWRALRLMSVLLGAGVVVLAYLIGLKVTGEMWGGWVTAVFVAFLPQHVAILASINNDSLAELLIAGILLGLVLESQRPKHTHDLKTWLTVGLLLGFGFLTKGTVYLLFPVVGLVWLVRFWGNWQSGIKTGLVVFGVAFALGALWWGRNMVVYGGLDVLGKAAHDSVVVGQPRTSEWIAQFGLAETIRRFISTSFMSFWGQFGWMALPLNRFVAAFELFTLAVITGLGWHAYQTKWQWVTLTNAVLAATVLLAGGLLVGYNLTFVQHQGRYLFPALIPIGVGVAVGLGSLAKTVRLGGWLNWLALGFGLGLAAFDLFVLFRVIVPALG